MMTGHKDRVASSTMTLKPPWDIQKDALCLSQLETQPGVWEQGCGRGAELGLRVRLSTVPGVGDGRGVTRAEEEATHGVTCWGMKVPKKHREVNQGRRWPQGIVDRQECACLIKGTVTSFTINASC